MLNEAIPRLVARLRAISPDMQVTLRDVSSVAVIFASFPTWEIEVRGKPVNDDFQILLASLTVDFPALHGLSNDDFRALIMAENSGLRGVTLNGANVNNHRAVRVQSGFVAQKGRTRDEEESLLISLLAVLRYARLLQDRIQRSSAGPYFSFEMFHSQYIAGNRGRSRSISCPRSVFQGSAERVFGELLQTLRSDYGFAVKVAGPGEAFLKPSPASENLPELTLRMPTEAPIITLSTLLSGEDLSGRRSRDIILDVNQICDIGHYEAIGHGEALSFTTWKHLTNDLRLYSLDYMLEFVRNAKKNFALFAQAAQNTRSLETKARVTARSSERKAA